MPFQGEALSAAKIVAFNIPIVPEAKLENNTHINTDLRFGLMKPIGSDIRLVMTVNGTSEELVFTKQMTAEKNQTLSMSVPVSNKLPENLPIEISLFVRKSKADQEVLIQLDSVDTCMASIGSKVCVSVKAQ